MTKWNRFLSGATAAAVVQIGREVVPVVWLYLGWMTAALTTCVFLLAIMDCLARAFTTPRHSVAMEKVGERKISVPSGRYRDN